MVWKRKGSFSLVLHLPHIGTMYVDKVGSYLDTFALLPVYRFSSNGFHDQQHGLRDVYDT